MSMLPPGMLIRGRYRVERLIKRGGFGAVYEVYDGNLNQSAALKQLLVPGQKVRRQFKAEAEMLANLRHLSLPRVIDHFNDGGVEFLVMDYVPGDDLSTMLIRMRAPFSIEQVRTWGLQLLDVLIYLHNRRPPIVHRDIKPQNLKLQPSGSIMLLDFGLAKGHSPEEAASTSQDSIIAYTKGYAAPEQVRNKGTDARTDLYALGATLYNLLTNVEPVASELRLLATAADHDPDPLIPPHTLNPAVPLPLSNLLMAAMALSPSERPQSAEEMRRLLEGIRTGSGPLVPRDLPVGDESFTVIDRGDTEMALARASTVIDPGPPTRVLPRLSRDPPASVPKGLRPNRRRWLKVGLSVAILVIALLLAYFAWQLAESRPPPRYSLLRTLHAHTFYASSLGISSDEETLASASWDKTVKLWRVSDGAELRTLAGHDGYVLSIAFSPDGQTLASASADGTIKLWRVSDGAELRTLSGHIDWINSVVFSPNGQMLGSASSDSMIKLWRVSDGTELRTIAGVEGSASDHPVYGLAFAPDGNTLASASFTMVKLWRVSDGMELLTFFEDSESIVFSVAFSPDGQTLASASADGTVKLLRIRDGTELRTLSGHKKGVNDVAFSPDGQMLASASPDGTVRLWQVGDGQELRSLTDEEGSTSHSAASDVVFSPDGEMLASASADGTVKIWQVGK